MCGLLLWQNLLILGGCTIHYFVGQCLFVLFVVEQRGHLHGKACKLKKTRITAEGLDNLPFVNRQGTHAELSLVH